MKKHTLICLMILTTSLCSCLYALPTLPPFISEMMTDGNNTGTASLGIYMGKPVSGEAFRLNAAVHRDTPLYKADLGMEVSDECLSFLLKGSIYWQPLTSFKAGAVLTSNSLFMYGVMGEQNLAAGIDLYFTPIMNLTLNLGMGGLFKFIHIYGFSDGNGHIYRISGTLDFSARYTISRFTVTAGVSSHTDYSYNLLFYPAWTLAVEYEINSRLSAGLASTVQYADLFLSGYIDTVTLDLSCSYSF